MGSSIRHLLWAWHDLHTSGGYDPDDLRVVLSGSSAGGFGAAYHYAWVLDDLQWSHTMLLADAAMGMNGPGNGAHGPFAETVETIFDATSPSTWWNPGGFLPTYCPDWTCAVMHPSKYDYQSTLSSQAYAFSGSSPAPMLWTATAPQLDPGSGQAVLNADVQCDVTQSPSQGFKTKTKGKKYAQFSQAATNAAKALSGEPGFDYFVSHNDGVNGHTILKYESPKNCQYTSTCKKKGIYTEANGVTLECWALSRINAYLGVGLSLPTGCLPNTSADAMDP